MTQPTPVSPSERVVELDYVRGLALLGIYIMNMQVFNLSWGVSDDATGLSLGLLDEIVKMAREVFFSGKFNAMFSLLFAVGFTIQLQRLEAALGDAGRWIYVRRLLVLLGIGLLHGLVFWFGDVLHTYALLGFLLLLLRQVKDRWIITLAVACVFLPTLSHYLADLAYGPMSPQQMQALETAEVARDQAAFAHGTVSMGVQRNAEVFGDIYSGYFAAHRVVYMYAELLMTMLVGLLAGRHRWFQRAAAHPLVVTRVQRIALAVGILTAAGLYYAASHHGFGSNTWLAYLYGYSYRVCRAALMVFYVTSLLRLIQRPAWATGLRPLALAGRMALSNYLLQTAIALFIFRPWGLGLYGRCGPAASFALAVGIYVIVQLPFSVWWLRRFQFGPLEYLWRAATYGRFPPMRGGVAA